MAMTDVCDAPAEGRFETGVHRFPARGSFEGTDLSGGVDHADDLRSLVA